MSLLPPNTSQLEKAIAEVTSSLGDIPTPIRSLWNAYTCPAALLPWLAWSYSVDQWDDNWSEAQKRESINKAILIHQKKGTPKAMKAAIAALGYELELVEWWQTTGRAPGTFGIDIKINSTQSQSATQTLLNTIDRTKNTRSHLWGISYQYVSQGRQAVGAAQSFGLSVHAIPKQHDLRIEVWAGELGTLPEDYLVCDGSKLERALYPDLFFALGYTYSEWDKNDPGNKDYFRLPDLRGLTILGTTSSEEVGQYQEDKVMWHEHSVSSKESPSLGASTNHGPLSSSSTSGRSAILPSGSETVMTNISAYFMLKIRPFSYQNVIGEIAFNPAPKKLTYKALACDGSAVSRARYPELFSIIGTMYGAGDGATTFNLPRIDDIYVRGTSYGSGVDPDATTRKPRGDGVYGDSVGTLQDGAIGRHRHLLANSVNWSENSMATGNFQKVIGATTVTSQQGGYILDRNARFNFGGQEFIANDIFGEKNYMKSLKMKAVIFYA